MADAHESHEIGQDRRQITPAQRERPERVHQPARHVADDPGHRHRGHRGAIEAPGIAERGAFARVARLDQEDAVAVALQPARRAHPDHAGTDHPDPPRRHRRPSCTPAFWALSMALAGGGRNRGSGQRRAGRRSLEVHGAVVLSPCPRSRGEVPERSNGAVSKVAGPDPHQTHRLPNSEDFCGFRVGRSGARYQPITTDVSPLGPNLGPLYLYPGS